MGDEHRWDPCVVHRGNEVGEFLNEYFTQPDRNILLVAGAGFDPRSCPVAIRLNNAAASVRALLIREERPNSPKIQSDRAEANTSSLLARLAVRQVISIKIFGPDGAVIGGRNIIKILSQQDLKCVTDVIVDISALSVGMSFPVIRYFVERIDRSNKIVNLHVFVVHDPDLDASIRSISSDAPSYVHGFKGHSTLSDMADAAKLWLPQLAVGRRAALERLYSFIQPDDMCPILPFPASNPRLGDALAEEYLTNDLENPWSVDTRNIVYAHEEDPLDIYRTILRLDDLRKPVFAETGGSMLVLSPLGSKVMALGALMAAMEHDLPVAYLESVGYEVKREMPVEIRQPNLIHLWLEGDAYPQPRPALSTQGGDTQ